MTTIVVTVLLLAIAALAVYLSRDMLSPRATPDVLQPGKPLPSLELRDEHGGTVNSDQLRGAPAAILFVRGSWCPFCSKQVRNLTAYYKEITDLGARLILITPKPLETTRRVADFFAVDFEFWLDESLSASRDLGLLIENGVPKGYESEYGEDTLWPTSIVIDADGIIRMTAMSRFVADRPNPEKLLRALKSFS